MFEPKLFCHALQLFSTLLLATADFIARLIRELKGSEDLTRPAPAKFSISTVSSSLMRVCLSKSSLDINVYYNAIIICTTVLRVFYLNDF